MILCDGNYGLGAYGMDLVHSRPREPERSIESRCVYRIVWRIGLKYIHYITNDNYECIKKMCPIHSKYIVYKSTTTD